MKAAKIASALADRIEALAFELLPGGHREGHEWRAGSVAGEAGSSLGVHLVGRKRGVWCDFATGEAGDSLDLVRAVRKCDMAAAIGWSRRWLGIDEGESELPARPPAAIAAMDFDPDLDRWRYPWRAAGPIAGTPGEAYLWGRGLHFDDPTGRLLRFARRRARKNTADELEYHPAVLALMRNVCTRKACGIVNIYLIPNGSGRIRDNKGKTCTGRAAGAAVMLSAFDEPTMGLVVCEGVETGIAVYQSGLRPVWSCGGAGNLAAFPVLGGIEALTIGADADEAGRQAAETCAARWREAGREAVIVAPPAGDWADGRRRRT
jgi:hypothetical protein